MPEARLARTRKAYVEAPKWRPMHENAAERLKRRDAEADVMHTDTPAGGWSFFSDRDLGDETPWAV